MGEPEHTDVVVIGMGPGGEYAAGALAEAGLHVTAVEERLVGGECPYFGCVPSKMMIRAGNLIAEARRVPEMAGSATVTPDWSPVALRIPQLRGLAEPWSVTLDFGPLPVDRPLVLALTGWLQWQRSLGDNPASGRGDA